MTESLRGLDVRVGLAVSFGVTAGAMIGAAVGAPHPHFGSIWTMPPDDSFFYGGLGACIGGFLGLLVALVLFRLQWPPRGSLHVFSRQEVGLSSETQRIAVVAVPLLAVGGAGIHLARPQVATPMVLVPETVALWGTFILSCLLIAFVLGREAVRSRTGRRAVFVLMGVPAIAWFSFCVWFLPQAWSLRRAERISDEALQHCFWKWRDAYLAHDEAQMMILRDRGGPLIAEAIDRFDALHPAFGRTWESTSLKQLQSDWGYPHGQPYEGR